MKNITRFLIILFAPLAISLLMSCASEVDKKIEEAQFLLDRGEYSQAEVILRDALAIDADNTEAKFLLASALIGKSVLGEGRSYLGLLADLLGKEDAGESAMETFARIAPASGARLADLEEATDTLAGLTGLDSGNKLKDVYLQLYISRLFEIAGAITRIGGNTEDNLCNANHANPNKDGVPDNFDPNALSTEQTSRFRDNLQEVNPDGQKAGLPLDFGLNDRITEIKDDLDIASSLADFLKTSFGDTGDETICVP